MRFLFLTIFIVLLIEKLGAEIPEKITNCKAKLANGKIIDLTSLDNASNPR